jgi:hypothetical protein
VAESTEPAVGIFWLFEGRLVIDAIPVSQAEPYGDNLTYPESHFNFWTGRQQSGTIPLDVEYDEVPRGRIVYQAKQEHFTLYADKCILKRQDVVQAIMARLNLPAAQTSLSEDLHYRCQDCSRGSRLSVLPLNWGE